MRVFFTKRFHPYDQPAELPAYPPDAVTEWLIEDQDFAADHGVRVVYRCLLHDSEPE